MEKFDSSKHRDLLEQLPFSYFSTAVQADASHHIIHKNGEDLVVWQDVLYPNDFPCVFPPHQENNWERCSVTFAEQGFIEDVAKKDIKVLVKKPSGTEFFYTTDSFIVPRGSLKRDIDLFKESHTHELRHSCESEMVADFYIEWKKQKKREGKIFEQAEEFFGFCLSNLDKYKIKQTYVFIKDRLVGFAWGVPHSHGKWVGLHLKTDYAYNGLSRYLQHLRAVQFKDSKEFSLGTDAHEPGIEEYKRSLHPSREVPYFYVLTGEKG